MPAVRSDRFRCSPCWSVSERFTGEFSTDSTADEILNVLMHTNHFSYKKDGRIIRVMKK